MAVYVASWDPLTLRVDNPSLLGGSLRRYVSAAPRVATMPPSPPSYFAAQYPRASASPVWDGTATRRPDFLTGRWV